MYLWKKKILSAHVKGRLTNTTDHNGSAVCEVSTDNKFINNTNKICVTAIALIITVVTVQTFTFFNHCIAFSIAKGRSDILFLERFHSSLALLHKYVTPRICPRKISDAVCNHPSSSMKNYQFCRHRNTVLPVVQFSTTVFS